MKAGEIFQYDEPREILLRLFEDKKNKNPLFSMRAWSKKLGFQNPSYLSDVLGGKRKLKPQFALKIGESLELGVEEKSYFKTLVFLEEASTEEEKTYYRSILHKLKPQVKQMSLGEEHPFMKDWRAMFMTELPSLKDFRVDYQYLSKRVGFELTPQAAEFLISELVRAGTLARTAKGALIRPQRITFTPPKRDDTKPEPPYFAQIKSKWFELATQSIAEQTRNESAFFVNSIPIRVKDFSKIRDMLLQSLNEVNNEFEVTDGEADEVYVINVGLFRATKPVPE